MGGRWGGRKVVAIYLKKNVIYCLNVALKLMLSEKKMVCVAAEAISTHVLKSFCWELR